AADLRERHETPCRGRYERARRDRNTRILPRTIPERHDRTDGQNEKRCASESLLEPEGPIGWLRGRQEKMVDPGASTREVNRAPKGKARGDDAEETGQNAHETLALGASRGHPTRHEGARSGTNDVGLDPSGNREKHTRGDIDDRTTSTLRSTCAALERPTRRE